MMSTSKRIQPFHSQKKSTLLTKSLKKDKDEKGNDQQQQEGNNDNNNNLDERQEDDLEDIAMDRVLLRPTRRVRLRLDEDEQTDWRRAYWLGLGLFLVLFSFWLLDSLKDPILGVLVGGNLDRHIPTAKLFSVCTTLCLVCAIEYISNHNQQQQQQQNQCRDMETDLSDEDVLDAGGHWTRMPVMQWMNSSEYDLDTTHPSTTNTSSPTGMIMDPSSSRIFLHICMPYCVFFGIMASILQFNPFVALMDPSAFDKEQLPTSTAREETYWHVIGYCLFAAIESFGSIAVATFWSFCNSTLSLAEAEQFYGIIIALAQVGAILGSTLVTLHIWSSITLMVLACLIIVLHVVVMRIYSRRFPPTNHTNDTNSSQHHFQPVNPLAATSSSSTHSQQHPSIVDPMWSGIYPILRYNYVLLILGASCLYEVSLTCLNYQMTLLGYSRFSQSEDKKHMTFKQFMGHYGQMVNISSLLFSAIVFPWLISKYGLRWTIRLFPTLLIVANMVAFGALPGNLTVLFFSMSFLKAMTYSIHDPSKELLYLPTSPTIKFKTKFWIDVVGARIAKAFGSLLNRHAGSVEQSIRVASAPSLLTAAALWWTCYQAGKQFDLLVQTNTVVGGEEIITTTTLDAIEMYAKEDDGEGAQDVPSSEVRGNDDVTNDRIATSIMAPALAPQT